MAVFLRLLVYVVVLGLAEMELIVPIAALVVLCSASVARRVLIAHQRFGYC